SSRGRSARRSASGPRPSRRPPTATARDRTRRRGRRSPPARRRRGRREAARRRPRAVLAVLASRLDPAARDLVAAWSSADAALLSAEDLSSEGWFFRLGEAAGGRAVVDGRRVAVRDLRAVLTRRPAVVAEELAWIDPGDRDYVAAEANAFLVAWLAS